MPVKIRLARHGKKHQAYYHIVVADGRAPRDGKFIEVIGKYDPNSNPATIELNNEKALSWLHKGAQPTDTTRAILSYKGVLFQKHLARGIAKGLLTQEVADAKLQQWIEGKNNKIEEKRKRIQSGFSKEMETRLAEEAKKKEAIAERVRIKNTPPPAPEPREAPPPPVAAVIPATALPEAPATAPAPVVAAKRVVTKKTEAKASAPAVANNEKPQQPAPEPKASDDDLRKFLDDRR